MKRSLTLVAAILLSANWAGAQTESHPEADRAPSPVTAGAPASPNSNTFFILAEFTHSLNAKKLKAGDKIKAEVTQDLLSHGRILIPVGSKLVGHVTEAKGWTSDDQESRLGIVFDKIILNHHHEVTFQGVIQSLEAPAPRRSKVDEPDQMMPPIMGGSQGGMSPMGGSSGRGSATGSTTGTSSTMSNVASSGLVYVDGTPGSNVGNSAGGDLNHPSKGRAPDPPAVATRLSTGMPRGVYGIKGLALTPGPTAGTPGPGITSSERDIKLDYGTQVLLKATDPHPSKQ
jgi:hypothetical protein